MECAGLAEVMQVVVTSPIEAPFLASLALALFARTEARGATSEACLDVCCLITSSSRLGSTGVAWTSEDRKSFRSEVHCLCCWRLGVELSPAAVNVLARLHFTLVCT